VDSFICSRFGPSWNVEQGPYPTHVLGRTYTAPFQLTVPPGFELRFRLQAEPADGSPIHYETIGWPGVVSLDRGTGRFHWKVVGPAGLAFPVLLEAVSDRGGRASFPMRVTIASEATQLVWRAGLGGKAWPDCDRTWASQEITEADLDGDGLPDALLSRRWAFDHEVREGMKHSHQVSSHEIVLRRRAPGRPDQPLFVDWVGGPRDSEGFQGDVTLVRAAGGVAILHVVYPACSGPDGHEFIRIVRGAPEQVARFGHPEVKGDDRLEVKLERNAGGEVEAIRTVLNGRTRRHRWNGRRFGY
jgi:hypothetical protein